MPEYSIFVRNEHTWIKYPRMFDLADVDAARAVALKIARNFVGVVPHWGNLSLTQRNGFVVEILDETGQTVLTVPFKEAEESKS